MIKFFLGVVLLASSLMAAEDHIAIVSYARGKVEALKKGATSWIKVAKDDVFSSGDIIRTGKNSSCELYLMDGTIFEIGSSSSLKIQEITGDKKHLKRAILDLEMGDLLSEIHKGLDYRVRTPQAICAVRGTKFAVKISASGISEVGVFSGKVGVYNFDKSGKLSKYAKIVKENQEALVKLYAKPKIAKKLSEDMLRIRRRMIKERARRKRLKREILKRRKKLLEKREKAILKRNKILRRKALRELRHSPKPRRIRRR